MEENDKNWAAPTSSKGMVDPSLITTHGVLHGLVGREVDRVSRTSSDYDTGHTTPQAENALAGRYLVSAAQHSCVGGRGVRVEYLHPRLSRGNKRVVSFRVAIVSRSRNLRVPLSHRRGTWLCVPVGCVVSTQAL